MHETINCHACMHVSAQSKQICMAYAVTIVKQYLHNCDVAKLLKLVIVTLR